MMASQVPYSPVPQVAARDEPTPFRSENVPAAAFGALTAQATERLGGTMGQVGNELYSRAIAMQELDQQAKANEAVAANERQQISGYLDFTQKMGKDAADGYQPYMDNAENIRRSVRATLTSPYAQRLYDNESRNATNRIIFSAGIHAKDQLKQYTLGGYKARMDNAADSAAANPKDMASFQAGLADTEKAANDYATAKGMGDDERKNFVNTAKSNVAIGQLMGIAKNEPGLAAKLRDQYKSDGTIGGDTTKLDNYITSQMHTVQSRVSADNLMAGKGHEFGAGIVSPELARIGITGVEGPSYQQLGPVVKTGLYAGQQALGHYQVMPGNLQQWLREANMPSMTPQEFLQNNAAQDQLFDTRFGARMKALGSFNRAALEWFTGNPDAQLDGRGDGYHSPRWYLDTANAAMAGKVPEKTLVDVARTKAASESPNDPLYPDIVAHQVQLKRINDERDTRLDQMEARQTISEQLAPQADGKLVTSEGELLANPDVKAAWDRMKPTDREAVRNRLIANARQGGYAATPETESQYRELMGIASDPDRSPDDAKRLLDFDALGWKAPGQWVHSIQQQQAKVLKGFTADPQVSKAMGVLSESLEDAGISKRGDARDYYQFRGTLQQVMQEYIRDRGKPPDDDEIKLMGSRLMQKMSTTGLPLYQGGQPGRWWGYNPGVPDQAKKIITQQYRQAHGGSDPDEATVSDIYNAAVYREQFGKKTLTPVPPSGPSFGGPR